VKRFLPAIVFLLTAALGLLLSGSAYLNGAEANRLRSEAIAEEAVHRIRLKIEQHLTLLTATLSLFRAASEGIAQSELRSFVAGLQTRGTYSGIQAIGFATLMPAGSEHWIESEIARDYDLERSVFPETHQPVRVVVTMIEPADRRNIMALGFDLFSDAVRRDAILESVRGMDVQATGKIHLVQEVEGEPQAGFAVYAPFFAPYGSSSGTRLPNTDRTLRGIIFAAFRAGDLHEAALSRLPVLPVHLESYDGQVETSQLLYRSPELNGEFIRRPFFERELRIAGRAWIVRAKPSAAFHFSGEQGTALILGAISLIAAAALAASARSQLRTLQAAQELSRVSERAVREKEMLLQEMTHRLKNSIARIMAIARQSSQGTTTREEFMKTFNGRLHAMAASQEMLTRARGEMVDLRDLLKREVEQIFGDDREKFDLSGPPVDLHEQAVQGLGLIFHELATNALKYGSLDNGDTRIGVTWRHDGEALEIIWAEKGEPTSGGTENPGFGTRLIDACVAQLDGRIDRNSDETGLTVALRLPAANI
jgi:CHASE1-domain containing sensor protein